MVKRFYGNEHEKAKWQITQDFIGNRKFDVVVEGFAGLGYLSSFYLGHCRTLVAIEKHTPTFKSFCVKYDKYLVPFNSLGTHVFAVNDECLNHLKRLATNDPWVNVIDLDPWGASKREILESLRILKGGYLLWTNTGPYWITERHMTLNWLGINPTCDWKNLPEIFYKEFVKPNVKRLGKKAELIGYYVGSRICRLVVHVKE